MKFPCSNAVNPNVQCCTIQMLKSWWHDGSYLLINLVPIFTEKYRFLHYFKIHLINETTLLIGCSLFFREGGKRRKLLYQLCPKEETLRTVSIMKEGRLLSLRPVYEPTAKDLNFISWYSLLLSESAQTGINTWFVFYSFLQFLQFSTVFSTKVRRLTGVYPLPSWKKALYFLSLMT